MEAASLRPARRTSFGEQLRAARGKQLKELRSDQQKIRRGTMTVQGDSTSTRAEKTQAQSLDKQEKAALQQQYRDEARRKREQIKKEKQREREKKKAVPNKVAFLDNGDMNKGYAAPKSHRGNDRVFKTVPFTKEGKIEVRIDERTVIYVREGDDIEAAKNKILNRHDQYKNQQKARLEGKNQAMRDFE